MKRFISIILAGLLLFGTPVFAVSGMEQALSAVKERVEIPADLTEFESSTSTNSNGKTTYRFSWYDADYEKSLYITADHVGHIKSLSQYDNTQDRGSAMPHLHAYSMDEIVTFAEDALRQYLPEGFADETDRFYFDAASSDQTLNFSNFFYVSFVRMKDEVPVPDNTAQIHVRLGVSELSIESCSINWDFEKPFEDLSGVMDISRAETTYKETFPLALQYHKYTQKDADAILLEYVLENASSNFIDAKTGAVVTRDHAVEDLKTVNSADSALAESASGRFSPAELAELQNVAGLLTATDIAADVKSMTALNLPEELEVRDSYLYKNKEDYIYNITLDHANDPESSLVSVAANAKTGEITSIYRYNNSYYTPEKDRPELLAEEILGYQKKAEAFLSAHYGTQFAQVKLKKAPDTAGQGDVLWFYYTRQIDGVPYISNTLTVAWNTRFDYLQSFSMVWDKGDLSVPNKANCIAQNMAYKVLLADDPVRLVYIPVGDVYQPVYAINGTHTVLDALTGDYLNYRGEVEAPDTARPEYTDMNGHWAKSMVEELADYGIFFEGTAFQPDAVVTQKEFLEFICAATEHLPIARVKELDLYKQIEYRNLLTEEQIDPDAPLKKEDAARFLLRALGISEVAELVGIYVCDFSDAADISPENLGYCAIAKGFGILSGSDGKLYPQKQITRAEAMTLLYKFLTR